MDVTGDELAGIVDLFGGLTRVELSEALAELAYRQGDEYDPTAFESAIDEAVQSYHLVAVADDAVEAGDIDEPLLLAGPLAFPTLPPDAQDLPHILDIDSRSISTDAAAGEVVEMFRDDARGAIDAGDQSHVDTLLDASYELEAWAGVDLQEIREELADANV